jgi:hypothetical protein
MSADRQPVARTDTLVIVIENGRFADVKWRDKDGKQWDALCPVEVVTDGDTVRIKEGK